MALRAMNPIAEEVREPILVGLESWIPVVREAALLLAQVEGVSAYPRIVSMVREIAGNTDEEDFLRAEAGLRLLRWGDGDRDWVEPLVNVLREGEAHEGVIARVCAVIEALGPEGRGYLPELEAVIRRRGVMSWSMALWAAVSVGAPPAAVEALLLDALESGWVLVTRTAMLLVRERDVRGSRINAELRRIAEGKDPELSSLARSILDS